MATPSVHNHLPQCTQCSEKYARFSEAEKALTEVLFQLNLVKSLEVPFLVENLVPPRDIIETLNSLRERATQLSSALNISSNVKYSKIAHHAFERHVVSPPPIQAYNVTAGPSKTLHAAL
ncbi:MAG: hypothetical protein JSR39_03960 [Verrucomicrobia bacterium]|nr:hypothetical protein [Verrucomicrobiota bacterium]